MKKQEIQFFEEMQIDMKLEEDIKNFYEREKLTVKVQREFILEVVNH